MEGKVWRDTLTLTLPFILSRAHLMHAPPWMHPHTCTFMLVPPPSPTLQVLDGRDTLTLTLPFILWGALVISMYAASYTMLNQVSLEQPAIDSLPKVASPALSSVFYVKVYKGERKNAAP